MTNPIGVISMTYTRPFTAEHFPLFARMKRAGMDFCEMLVPEPGELDPAAAGRAAKDAGLFLLLAARVNVQRDLASDDAKARAAGLDYLRYCVDVATAMRRDHRRRTALRHAARLRRPSAASDRGRRPRIPHRLGDRSPAARRRIRRPP